VGRAAPEIVRALMDASEMLNVKTKVGLTVSCSGFFAPQGRDVGRIRPSLPEADRLFSEFNPRLQGQRVENMEMEASFLLHFLGGLGHRAGAICTTIAQRRTDAFDANYQESVRNATRTALLALAIARARDSTGG
jgi:uridine phosphorylase